MPHLALRRPSLSQKAGIADFERKAAEAAGLLKLLANENRLLILCRLAIAGEVSVGDLADAVDLSESALSQHLAKTRRRPACNTARSADRVLPHCSSECRAPARATQEHLLPWSGQPNKKERTVSNLKTISPERAAELVRRGAVLIDIREADEYAREHIPGARHRALVASMPTVPRAPATKCWYFIAALALALRATPLGFLRCLRLSRPIFLRGASTPGRRSDCRSRSTAANRSTSSGRCKSSPAALWY